MYDAAAIEAINFEQLVTATDRMLVRGGVRRRPGVPSVVPGVPSLVPGAPSLVPSASSARQPPHPPRPPLAPDSHPQVARPCDEPTAFVRVASVGRAQVFALTVVIPTLIGIAVGLAALL